jgi:uncharacterized membrane protein YraQ (UPF0718 family)
MHSQVAQLSRMTAIASAMLPASLFALGTGPLLLMASRQRPGLLALLDGFVLVAIGGIVLLDVLPHALHERNVWVPIVVALGLVLPMLAERGLHLSAERIHRGVLTLAVLGLALHSLLDGMALGRAMLPELQFAGLGIVLHQVPVSILIWLVMSSRPRAWTWGVLFFLAAMTLMGALLQPTLLHALPEHAGVLFEALVGGSLLHVIAHPLVSMPPSAAAHVHDASCTHDHAHSGTSGHAHQHGHTHEHAHGHAHGHPAPSHAHTLTHQAASPGLGVRGLGAIGALLGLLLLVAMHWLSTPTISHEILRPLLATLQTLMLDTAPALLVAYAAAGLVSAFVAPQRLAWVSRGSRLRQAVSGMALGLPLPICSCGVAPLYQGLLRQGVAPTAALAFLVATPELGLDAVLLSLPLLGAPMTIVRVVAATIAAVAVALVAGRLAGSVTRARELPAIEPIVAESTGDKLRRAARMGLIEMVDHTAPWILLGIAVATLLSPILEHSWLTSLPTGLDVVVFALVGLPLYVCASASTPLVAVLIAAGVSPGAGLALLITGPATNIGTLGILGRVHTRPFALRFAVLMFAIALLLGWLTNLLLPTLAVRSLDATLAARDGSALEYIAVALLLGLFIASVFRQGPRGFLGEIRLARAT